MNEEKQETAIEQAPETGKVEPQTAEPKPEKTVKVAKKAKAKPTKVKKAAKKAKAPAKPKAKTAKKADKTKKSAKTAKAATTKSAKIVPQGKFPRHAKNPFRVCSSYGAIFDAFILKKNGIQRHELLQLAMDATGKDAKHAAYDLAVIRSAHDSNTGPRHPSCREGFWVKREGDCFTLKVD